MDLARSVTAKCLAELLCKGALGQACCCCCVLYTVMACGILMQPGAWAQSVDDKQGPFIRCVGLYTPAIML